MKHVKAVICVNIYPGQTVEETRNWIELCFRMFMPACSAKVQETEMDMALIERVQQVRRVNLALELYDTAHPSYGDIKEFLTKLFTYYHANLEATLTSLEVEGVVGEDLLGDPMSGADLLGLPSSGGDLLDLPPAEDLLGLPDPGVDLLGLPDNDLLS